LRRWKAQHSPQSVIIQSENGVYVQPEDASDFSMQTGNAAESHSVTGELWRYYQADVQHARHVERTLKNAGASARDRMELCE